MTEGEETHQFLQCLMDELRDWKNSSFGDDLWKDVSKLPVQKQSEYVEGFEHTKNVTQEEVDYRLFEGSVMQEVVVRWKPRTGPLHEYIHRRIDARIAFLAKRSVESRSPPKDARRVRYRKGFADWSRLLDSELQRLQRLRSVKAAKHGKDVEDSVKPRWQSMMRSLQVLSSEEICTQVETDASARYN